MNIRRHHALNQHVISNRLDRHFGQFRDSHHLVGQPGYSARADRPGRHEDLDAVDDALVPRRAVQGRTAFEHERGDAGVREPFDGIRQTNGFVTGAWLVNLKLGTGRRQLRRALGVAGPPPQQWSRL